METVFGIDFTKFFILRNGRFKKKKLLAKATFDNIAESTDELAFRKGEILTVIETDTNGLKGWWLCQLRGRQPDDDSDRDCSPSARASLVRPLHSSRAQPVDMFRHVRVHTISPLGQRASLGNGLGT
uniref:SH3 domain-containing protein n=1 Tax=Anopheles stephensi TaxID=30069 RepID=A0A182YL04_ANOST